VELLVSYSDDAVAVVTENVLLDELELVASELVEFVFHLPHRRLVEELNRRCERRLLVECLPQVRPVCCNQILFTLPLRFFV